MGDEDRPETDGIPDEPAKELAKQFVLYADSITAFAFIQSVALGYALWGNKDIAANIGTWNGWTFVAVVVLSLLVYAFYVFIVERCHAGENFLVGGLDARSCIGKWKARVWQMRTAIIIFAGALVVSCIVLTWYSRHHINKRQDPCSLVPAASISAPKPSSTTNAT
jgi:hypothetical protein